MHCCRGHKEVNFNDMNKTTFNRNVKEQKISSQDFNVNVLRRSESCPSLILNNHQKIDKENEISMQIMKLAIEGCESAEKFSLENQGRFCLKNLHKLCAKTKEQVKKTEMFNARNQDKHWMMKNYIFSFARVSEGWKGLENLLLNEHEEYRCIEEKFYDPGIRDTFYEWQYCTRDLLSNLYDGFQLLHESIERDLKTNLVSNKINREVLPCASTSKKFVKNENVSMSPILYVLPKKTEIPKINHFQNYSVDNDKICENTHDFLVVDDLKNSPIKRKLSPDSEWRVASQSALKLVEKSQMMYCNENIITPKKKCNKKDIKKAGTVFIKYLKEELCDNICNRRMEIIAHRPMWKNSITLDDIQNKLKKYQYNDVDNLLKDFERMFYSMLDYFKNHPDDLLENVIINVRENFWIIAREKLLITD